VRIDQSAAGGDQPPADAGTANGPPDTGARGSPAPEVAPRDVAARVTPAEDYRARVDAVYRAYAIDQGYARVREIEEETVTPAMKRIEAEDPERHLAGLENRLKGKERLAEKVHEAMTERARTVDQAFATVKDAIRYTFCYSEELYTEGVHRDCERLERAGFQPVERRNSWESDQYKGINSRWRVPANGQIFEVQFHTQASLEAKEETHWAYEKLRDPTTTKPEQEALTGYQRTMNVRVPIPPGATEISDYKYPRET
jgi:hypothetical protein